MFTYVSKENNLRPGDKKSISGVLKVRFLFCKAQLVRTNFLYPYEMRSVFRNALVNGYIS